MIFIQDIIFSKNDIDVIFNTIYFFIDKLKLILVESIFTLLNELKFLDSEFKFGG